MMKAQGFTLIEILAAIAVFAIMSVMAYGSLNMLVRQYQQGEEQVGRLAELQRTYSFLASDVMQMQARGVREEFHGDRISAVLGGEDKDHAFELTRAGWGNPAGGARSSIQRVAWTLDGDSLVRIHWPHLDRAPTLPPVVTLLMSGVESARWRFLDRGGTWHETWPPPDRLDRATDELPMAVELMLTSDHWGELGRIFVRARTAAEVR